MVKVRVKIIEANIHSSLESEINAFLEEHELTSFESYRITYSTTANNAKVFHSALIEYNSLE